MNKTLGTLILASVVLFTPRAPADPLDGYRPEAVAGAVKLRDDDEPAKGRRKDTKPISPDETAKNVGKRVTVEFVAKSNGFNGEGEGFSELGSEKEFENKAWFALRFSRKAMAELAKNRITDLGYFVESKVVATGVVNEIDFGEKLGKRRFIYIDGLSQFKATPTKKPTYTPTKDYKVVKIRGFTVLFHPEVVAQAEEMKKAIDNLEKDLGVMHDAMPKDKLAKLLKVRIWMEWDEKSGADFHPSAVWLREHGKNPDKSNGIDFLFTKNYAKDFATGNGHHHHVLIHEFSHAHQHFAMGGLDDQIKIAYTQAMERKLYDSLKWSDGKVAKGYAATNEKEYFADLSMIYFAEGIYYPFTRAELREHDPVGYKMVQDAWGVRDDGKAKTSR